MMSPTSVCVIKMLLGYQTVSIFVCKIGKTKADMKETDQK